MRIGLVDFNAVYWTAWHAFGSDEMNGAPARVRTQLREWELDEQFDALILCVDSETSFRRDMFPQYKVNRPAKDQHSVEVLDETLAELAGRYAIAEADGFEGDDIIATLAQQANPDEHHVRIIGCDKDLYQLLDRAPMYKFSKRSYYTIADLWRDYEIKPDQIPDWLGICGDKVDNLPGIPGAGPKAAQWLLEIYETLPKAVVAAQSGVRQKGKQKLMQSVADHGTQAMQTATLAKLSTQAPVELHAFLKQAEALKTAFRDPRVLAGALPEDPWEEDPADPIPPPPPSAPTKKEPPSMFTVRKATRERAKLRMALIGTAGSGKTFTALTIGCAIGKRVCVIDSENGTSHKEEGKSNGVAFTFDVLEWDSALGYGPEMYVQAIHHAEAQGYDVIIIDSLSHAWAGKGGALEQVDNAAARFKGNTYFAWRDVTPKHNELVEAMLRSPAHIIATMRNKCKYELEKDSSGKVKPVKVGLQPVQREGLDYEFDITADLDRDHTLVIDKTRCSALDGKVFKRPGVELAETIGQWLHSGADPMAELAAGIKGADNPRAYWAQNKKRINALSSNQRDELIAIAKQLTSAA